MTLKSPLPPLSERVGAFAKMLAIDLGALGGTLMIVHGIDLVYRPAAWIVAGLLVLAFTVRVALRP